MNRLRAVALLASGLALVTVAPAKSILRQDSGRDGKLVLRGAVVTYPVLKPAGGLARQPVQGITLRRIESTPRTMEKLSFPRMEPGRRVKTAAPLRPQSRIETPRAPIVRQTTVAAPATVPVVSVAPAGKP